MTNIKDISVGNQHKIWIPDVVVPKLRPRFKFLSESEKERRTEKAIAQNKIPDNRDAIVYLDSKYRGWKEKTVDNLLNANSNQFGDNWDLPSAIGELTFPVSPVNIHVDFFGTMRGDRDNLYGSILDSLVDAEMVGGMQRGQLRFHDAPSFVPQGSYRTWESSKRKGTLVILTKLSSLPKITESQIFELYRNNPVETTFIWIPGKCFSKLRPRGSNGHIRNKQEYVFWKNSNSQRISYAIKYRRNSEFNLQRVVVNNNLEFPAKSLEISVSFVGKGHLGDCDNRLAGIMDVLVDAGICPNDGVRCVPNGSFQTLDSEEFGTIVEIKKRTSGLPADVFLMEATKTGYSDTEDLLLSGWNKQLIKKYLHQPDKIKNHPLKAGKYLELYLQQRVDCAIAQFNLELHLKENTHKTPQKI